MKTFEQFVESLWANIHKKRQRIKQGSGERMRKKGEKGAPTPAQLARAKSEDNHTPLDRIRDKHKREKEQDNERQRIRSCKSSHCKTNEYRKGTRYSRCYEKTQSR